MKGIIDFLVTQNGRIARIVVGAALAIIGLVVDMNLYLGVLLIVVGAVAAVAGALDYCLLGAVIGKSIKGKDLRK